MEGDESQAPSRQHTRRSTLVAPKALPTLPSVDGRGWFRRTLYALASIPLAFAYAGLSAGLALAAITAVLGIGVLVLIGLLALARGLGGFERAQARLLLDAKIDAGVRQRHEPESLLRRLRNLLTASSTWRTVAWLAARGLIGVGVLTTVSAGLGAAGFLAVYPRWLGLPTREPWIDVAVAALDVLLALLVLIVIDAQARLAAVIAPRLLGPSRADELARLHRRAQRLADRNRLARELHDTIGHSLTASLVQATAARRSLSTGEVDPTFARGAIEHIEASTRDALAELDRALAVLREDTIQQPSTPGTTAPRTGADLTGLDGLLTGLRDGGLPVSLSVTGDLDRVPLPHSQIGYRIVQEATTNVLRHTDCAPTTIAVSCADRELTIRVRNKPAPPPTAPRAPGGGRGLDGLRERIAPLGGRLTAQPSPDGGFELTASLPHSAVS